MAVVTKGGSSIMHHALRLSRLVKKYTPVGAMAYGVSAPGAAALSLMADIIIALDAAGAFGGQTAAGGGGTRDGLEGEQMALLLSSHEDKIALATGTKNIAELL